MDRATILIIDHAESSSLKERLNKQPDFAVIGSTDSPDLGFTLAERHQPDLIMLNVDMPGNRGPSVAEVLALEFPMSSLILTTNSDSKRVLHLALQVGAKDVVNLPIEDEKLFRIVQRVVRQDQKRREMFSVQKKEKPQFKTVTVFSTKGGVGKSTVALNLALAIRELTGKRVAAVDLDLYSGNLALMAGVTWKRSIKDMVDEVNNLDREVVDAYCVEHPSGLKILPSPTDPDFAGFVQPEHVHKILGLLNEVFNYVVVDAPTYLHDVVLPALELSQEVVLVTTQDLASLQNLKQSIDLLARLTMRSKIRVVVNRVGYTGGLKLKDLEGELGMEVQCVIPNNEKLAVDSVNMGVPMFLAAKNSLVARRLSELAGKIVGTGDRGHQLAAVSQSGGK